MSEKTKATAGWLLYVTALCAAISTLWFAGEKLVGLGVILHEIRTIKEVVVELKVNIEREGVHVAEAMEKFAESQRAIERRVEILENRTARYFNGYRDAGK